MTTKPEIDTGRALLVWHEDDGVIHKHPATNMHELSVFVEIMQESMRVLDDDPLAEVCGYLERLHNSSPYVMMKAVQVDNVATEGGEFAYSDEDAIHVYELIERGDCLGLWHSHPSGDDKPSDDDWLGHPRDTNVPMYIVAISQDHPVTCSVTQYTEADRP